MVPLMARFVREHAGRALTLHVANTRRSRARWRTSSSTWAWSRARYRQTRLPLPAGAMISSWCSARRTIRSPKNAPGGRDLRRGAWIVREPGSGTRQAFDHAMHGILPDLHIELELQHTEAIKSAVMAGLGVGCVSRLALEEEFRHQSLVPCRVPQRNFRRHFYFAVHSRSTRAQRFALGWTFAQFRRGYGWFPFGCLCPARVTGVGKGQHGPGRAVGDPRRANLSAVEDQVSGPLHPEALPYLELIDQLPLS